MRWVLGAGLVLWALSGCSQPGPQLAPLPDVSLDGLAPTLSERLGPSLEALAGEPRSASDAGRAGMLLLAYEQHGLAAPFLERASALEPGELRWQYYLGIALARLGRHADAARRFRLSAEMSPEFLPARRRLAGALLESGEIEAGLSSYRRLAELAPGDARVRYGLGRAESAAGNPAAARDQLLRAVALAPGYGAAHYALAQAYSRLGMTDESASQTALYERNRLGEPTDDDPLAAAVSALRVSAAEYLKQGVEAREQGRVEAAIKLHLRALEEDPGLVQARVNLLILFGAAGEADKAERQYRLALAAGDPTAELHYNFGVLAYGAGRTDEAREAFRQALAINPEHALANHNLGQMLEEEGQHDEAMARYRRALASRPDHGLSHYKVGMLWMRQRRASEAVAAFREAAKEQSDRTPTYLFSLAAALLASGDRDAATAAFRRARAQAERSGQQALVDRIDEALRAVRATPDSR